MSYVKGADALLKKLDAMPREAEKIALRAMREAGKEAARVQKQVTANYWPGLVKSSAHKDAFGKPYVSVGYQSRTKKGARGADIPDWFKAYWMNYGTLKHRREDIHKFQRKIRNVKRRNNEGQPAKLFFQEGHPMVRRAFDSALKKKFEELIEKYYNSR